ncbi:hypothetical protein Tco_0643832 [Tanacetum coccineum]
MCDRMFPEEIDQVEKYVGGLPDTIHGSVMATKPKTMQDAIEFATELMDKKINTMLNVRRQQNKESPKCQHWGYQRLVLNWCSEHSKKDCPKLKNNNNRVIRPGNAKGSAKVYAVGQCGVTPDNNVDTANITATKDEDKSKEKRLEDVPVVQEFPEVFPKTCHNIPTPLDRVELPNQLELTEKGFIRQVSLPGELQVLFCEKNRWVFRIKKEHEEHLRNLIAKEGRIIRQFPRIETLSKNGPSPKTPSRFAKFWPCRYYRNSLRVFQDRQDNDQTNPDIGVNLIGAIKQSSFSLVETELSVHQSWPFAEDITSERRNVVAEASEQERNE